MNFQEQSPGTAISRDESPIWHKLESAEVALILQSDQQNGLSAQEARLRLAKYGPNQLIERGTRPAWKLMFQQFTSVLVIVLIAAAVLAGLVGKPSDAVAIVAIIVLNGVLGFVQEYRADRAMAALRSLAVPKLRVKRSGTIDETNARDIVPGDIVILEAGNLVPADGRILESANLRIQESVLTGESDAVEKHVEALKQNVELTLGDQTNMAFMGTIVTYGRGQFMVTATGMQTQIGRVAELIQDVEPTKTPLQRRLDRLGHVIALAACIMLVLIFILGLLAGEDWRLMLMTAVSMAVAVIPEGLPAVITIALALGSQRMLKNNALIRKLPAVETLGSLTVICSDKTGTLTENRMTVMVMDLAGHRLELNEDMRHRQPVLINSADQLTLIKSEPALSLLLMGGALCNDSILVADATNVERMHALGDPTEGAFVIAAACFGLYQDTIKQAYPRVNEVPFDSERKRMTTVHRVENCNAWVGECTDLGSARHVGFAKGGVDNLLEICSRVWDKETAVALDMQWRTRIMEANTDLARSGMRVLGVAFRIFADDEDALTKNHESIERDMVFIGLVGMIDPPRANVRDAIAVCRRAGIQPVMITGDHPLTAERIAQDLGITQQGGVVLTGQELSRFEPEGLKEAVLGCSVYARVAPEQKLRIVEALQSVGHIVAMTGDGVNDAPALRRADIGVAMGITGTDVSKEAAAMVLLDDNFTTIVSAVEEGRSIYDNIRRFLLFSLAGNIGKLILVLCGPLIGMPLPFTPFQILWLNLVTDGLLGLGIGVEPPEPGTMQRKPRSPSEGILAGGLGAKIVIMGMLLGIANLAVTYSAWKSGATYWQTSGLLTVVLLQVVMAYANRSWSIPFFRMNLFLNKALLTMILLVLGLQALIIYVSPLTRIFGIEPLPPSAFIAPMISGVIILTIIEAFKHWVITKRS